MKRVSLALFTLGLLLVTAWPVSQAIGAGAVAPESALCQHMTPAKMLEHPALAHEWAQALRSSQPDEIARIEALLAEIRAAHGCKGEIAMPAPAPTESALPPGHPPVREERQLPPGHPPIPSGVPLFEAPAVYTI
ncbi:MAG TPA: hypothetical protein VF912_03705 [Anaeromyxobacter sp.]